MAEFKTQIAKEVNHKKDSRNAFYYKMPSNTKNIMIIVIPLFDQIKIL